jgi:hypothetical protein
MTRAPLLIVALLATACPNKPAPPDPDPIVAPPTPTGDLPARMLRRLSVAAECSSGSGVQRHWCAAADRWDSGVAGELPAGANVFVGLSLGLLEEGNDEDALKDNVFLAAFGVNSADGKVTALITDINPRGVDERKMVDEAIAQVADVLKGKAASIQLAPPLREYIAQIPPAANHRLVRGEKSWVLEGAARAEIRRIGDVWVALEQPTEGPSGLFVTMFWATPTL